MRRLICTAAIALGLATPALADIETVAAEGSVPEVMDRLESAVEGAGATVFARVDHAKGAASVDLPLEDSQLLIFGNPKLGTLPQQQDARAGLFLPLRVLVYSQDGETKIAWQEPAEMFDDLDIDDDAEFMAKMTQALQKFVDTAKAP
ncbi:DUF302 domain-containing protein [Paracoccus homiensis]|uniref:Uncharacterized conserved protein, DUF302 family n=1 Tax=Paracoccus homiensis TaxID=364199 RepID=A0A1I0DEM7_9RHOB|nr:DUF302 domain-containing protein [Paracoccus homiensis]SET30021.1 Uncharacterized conserved protein, DUF302 family [Paracoccus homiensis]